MQLSKDRPDLDFSPGDKIHPAFANSARSVVCWIGEDLLICDRLTTSDGRVLTTFTTLDPRRHDYIRKI